MALFKNYLDKLLQANTDADAAQSDASVGMEATPFTMETAPNPAGEGDMTVLVFPEDAPVLAIQVDGADFPWLFITAGDGIYLGDGTSDPIPGDDVHFS